MTMRFQPCSLAHGIRAWASLSPVPFLAPSLLAWPGCSYGGQVITHCTHKALGLSKARAAKRVADRMITLARRGDLAARRRAAAALGRKDNVSELFERLANQFDGRQGGYTRLVKLGQRRSDGSEMAILEWVGVAVPQRRKKKRKDEVKTS